MGPPPWRGGCGLLLGHGRPDAAMALRERAAPGRQPPCPHTRRAGTRQPCAPGRLRCALAARHRQHDLAAIGQRADQDPPRRLAVRQASLPRQAIGPDVHDLPGIEPAGLPGVIVLWPLGLQPLAGGGGQRRALAQQPTERQLDIAERHPMQVHPRPPLPHRRGPPLAQGQDAADDALGQAAPPRAPPRDRAAAQGERAPRAVPVAGPFGGVHGPPACPLLPPSPPRPGIFHQRRDAPREVAPHPLLPVSPALTA
ncbi:MAG TPA: hypothetical protein VNP04_04720 [Alphaproteobacteria bacterium]|nr:hypothetical protein [Alphaproteobacteria bacterium]